MAPLRRALAIILAAIAVAAIVIAHVVEGPGIGDTLVGMAWPLSNLIVGLLLTVRRPSLLTGWIFTAIGFLASTGNAADALSAAGLNEPGVVAPWWAVLAAWYGEWYWLPMLYATLVFLPLLFPTGRPLTPRWRRVTVAAAFVLGLVTVTAALQERLDPVRGYAVANPVGLAGLADVEDGVMGGILASVGAVSLILAAIGLVVRYRRSRGVERQQLKWFTSASVAMISGFILLGVGDALGFTRPALVDATLFTLPPIAAAIAIFRYRLYAIDRIISRTVTYFLVTALLVGVYAGGVALLSAVLDPLAGESPLAVAAATLAAAAVFRPALARIQGAVDRRFNRARYDAQVTLEAFRERVRSDVDLHRLCSDLVAVTDEALQPATATVWLRAQESAT